MKTLRIPSNDLPTRSFKSQDDWKEWLVKNHKRSDGIWLKLAKKGSPAPSLTYAEAVETALCFGWIDGQKKAHDEAWWLQKFTRRGPRSIWSKINRQKVEDLIASGQMQPAGLEAVDSAKRNGRWESAYNSPGTSNVPSDFHTALKANARAKEFLEQALLPAQECGDCQLIGDIFITFGDIYLDLGEPAKAAGYFNQALDLYHQVETPNDTIFETLIGLAEANLALNDLAQAQELVAGILTFLDGGGMLSALARPFRTYLTCYRVLLAGCDPRAATFLAMAHRKLQEQAARIPEEAMRRTFLENVAENRELMAEFARNQQS